MPAKIGYGITATTTPQALAISTLDCVAVELRISPAEGDTEVVWVSNESDFTPGAGSSPGWPVAYGEVGRFELASYGLSKGSELYVGTSTSTVLVSVNVLAK